MDQKRVFKTVYEQTYPKDLLQPRTNLYKMGLKPNANSVAVVQRGVHEYPLYELSNTTPLTIENATKEQKKYWIKGLKEEQTKSYTSDREELITEIKNSTTSKTSTKKEKKKTDSKKKKSVSELIGPRVGSTTFKAYKSIISKEVSDFVIERLNLPIYDYEDIPNGLYTPLELLSEGYIFNGGVCGVVIHPTGDKDYLYRTKNKEEINWLLLLKDIQNNPQKYVVLDTETTGVDDFDEVIQLTCLDFTGEILYDSYFNPSRKSHWAAAKKHKIKESFLKTQPYWRDEWDKIKTILKDKIILANNALFDIRLIQQTCLRYKVSPDYDLNYICTMAFLKEITGETGLEKALTKLKYKFDENILHNARMDCFMLLKVISPENDIFDIQEDAEITFTLYCKYKEEFKQCENTLEDGWAWIRREFNLSETIHDFSLLDKTTCIQIIDQLTPTLLKLEKALSIKN